MNYKVEIIDKKFDKSCVEEEFDYEIIPREKTAIITFYENEIIKEVRRYGYIDREYIYKIIDDKNEINLNYTYVSGFSLNEYRENTNKESCEYIKIKKISSINTFYDNETDYSHAWFEKGDINFDKTNFGKGTVSFEFTRFEEGNINFNDIYLGKGGDISFLGANFGNGNVNFKRSNFENRNVEYKGACFGKGTVNFLKVNIRKGYASFDSVQFGEGYVNFDNAKFENGGISFRDSNFEEGNITFEHAEFIKANAHFSNVNFGNGHVYFNGAIFEKCSIDFCRTKFGGGNVDFRYTIFDNVNVLFSDVFWGNGNVGFVSANFMKGFVDFSRSIFGKGDISFRDANFGEGDVFFSDVNFGEGKVNFKRTNFGHGNVRFDNVDFGRESVNFCNAVFGEGAVFFYETKFSGEKLIFKMVDADRLIFYGCCFAVDTDMRIKKVNKLVIQDCIIKQTFNFELEENVKLGTLNFWKTKNLGQIYTDYKRSDIRSKINSHQDSICVFNDFVINFRKANYDEKAYQFRLLKENFNSLGQYDDEDEAYVEFKRCERKAIFWSENIDNINKGAIFTTFTKILNPIYWLKVAINDWIGGYGTKPKNVAFTMMIIILGFAFGYRYLDSMEFIINNESTLNVKENISECIYYSGITFLTIGYGDVSPNNLYTQIASVVEGFMGIFLMSYFTVSFVRKLLR